MTAIAVMVAGILGVANLNRGDERELPKLKSDSCMSTCLDRAQFRRILERGVSKFSLKKITVFFWEISDKIGWN